MLRDQAAVTDVRPTSTGTVLATCECGLECTFASQADGWHWVLSHSCLTPARGDGAPRRASRG